MKITYDKKIDAMYIRLNEKATYYSSKKVSDNILIDYDKKGQIVSFEILDASSNTSIPDLKQNITLQPA